MTSITEKIIALFPELLATRTIEEIDAAVIRNGLVTVESGKLTPEERGVAKALKAELKRCIAWVKADQCSYIVGRRADLLLATKCNAADYAKIWARTMFPLNGGEGETNWDAIAKEIAPEFEEFVSLISGDKGEAA